MKGRFNDRNGMSRKIKQLSKDGEFIKEWPSAMEVQRVLGINSSNITSCVRGKLKSAYGFNWEYLGEQTN